MAGTKDITNIWRNIREVDLRPIQEEAIATIKIAIIGEAGSGREALARQMRNDPTRVDTESQAPVLVAGLENADRANDADLVILIVQPQAESNRRARELIQQWKNRGKKTLLFIHQAGEAGGPVLDEPVQWQAARTVSGSVDDVGLLLRAFVPAVMELLPEKHLALARTYPLFRAPVANRLINETSFSNGAYALSTGLAETIPVLGIPLNVADMVILTKAQAFLVYRLGMALGMTTRWQDYVSEFGSVIGGGFLWRQLARQLVGLIPVWGILPKVAVSYAGTYVVGHIVLEWYQTGRHVSRKQIRELYGRAFARGRAVAKALVERAPRPSRRPRLLRRKKAELTAGEAEALLCPVCGKTNNANASYCQYCGQHFEGQATIEEE